MDGLVYSRADMTWLPQEEYERRKADREERAFRREASQGEVCAPRIATDTMRGVQSQVDGRMYDSKSALRRHYRQSGVVEVGNDVPKTRNFNVRKDPKAREKRMDALGKAFSRVGLPTS